MRPSRLIITADDFGLSPEVNDAVEQAHREGVLTCASLLVTGPAAADAVRRARRMPALGVGLHLALLDAPSARACAEIPDLLAPDATHLGRRPILLGTRIALFRHVRDQVQSEMRAQFELFARSGLQLDHVNGHWHFHQHPTVAALLANEFAAPFGIRAVRAPREPIVAAWRAAGCHGLIGRTATGLWNAALWRVARRRMRGAALVANDWFFGLSDGGAVTRERLLGFIHNLPPGVTEIGLHPATAPPAGPFAPPPTWRGPEELQALLDPEVIEACRPIQRVRFSDLLQ